MFFMNRDKPFAKMKNVPLTKKLAHNTSNQYQVIQL